MGFFDSLKEKRRLAEERKRADEEKKRLEKEEEMKNKINLYYKMIMNGDVDKAIHEITPFSGERDSTRKMIDGEMHFHGLYEDERIIYGGMYKLYFGEHSKRLDPFFADDLIGTFSYTFYGNPDLRPVDLRHFPGLTWAKKYLDKNKDIILRGDLVGQASLEYCLLKDEKLASSLSVGNDSLELSDFFGNSYMKDIVFAKGLFEMNDRATMRYLLFLYKELLSPNKRAEMIESINQNVLSEFYPEYSKNYMPDDIFIELVQRIFIKKESNSLRNKSDIIYEVEGIFKYPFVTHGPTVFHD